jgi:hypothetical protein
VALRTAHGNARKRGAKTVIETLPIDELPAGLAAPEHVRQPARVSELEAQIASVGSAIGSLGPDATPSEKQRLKGRLGGLRRALAAEQAKASKDELERLSELANKLLPGMIVSDAEFQSGLPLAQDFIDREGKALAKDIGGGELPPGPGSMLITSALQMLASRVEFARGRFKEASQLGEASSASLARCHEYTARRATSREGSGGSGSDLTPTDARRVMGKLFRSEAGPTFTLDDIDVLRETAEQNSAPVAPIRTVYTPVPFVAPLPPPDEPKPARERETARQKLEARQRARSRRIESIDVLTGEPAPCATSNTEEGVHCGSVLRRIGD